MLALLAAGGHAASGSTTATAAASPNAVASGPTPFPNEAKDWPGAGAIRVFGWMNDNRKAFWLEREQKQRSVVFAGDSLVGGWTTLAKDLPGWPVANRGIGGEPSRGLLFRFQEDVLDLHPRAIVLLSGANDLSALQDVRHTRSNLVAMIEMAGRTSPGAPIVLCTLPPRDNPKAPVDAAQLLRLNQLITALADRRRKVVVLDVFALLAAPDGSPHAAYFASDKLHLSPAGYQRIRDALVPILKQFDPG